ncbi:alpha/beta fold hydrolase [Patulibacter brassicae]|jgi:pimeloyl-ACP methyl ester carboxylesterase|uniref:Alpha/beta fold hydrolase n=1 Tax=Patulibacter brassicae TaxID=1705717 RepID=A0ABU4VGT6_9ACTN|nr:alpha/beta fold hydrolase [Patulibacter brassicae]MDX8150123.1 alpha/beta fold hydrolase [Patulibacter brassicae]
MAPLPVPPEFSALHRGGDPAGEPLVLLHGFTDTWRTWQLVLPALEARYAVVAPTLPGHAGGPALPDGVAIDALLDGFEAWMDDQGLETAHLVGNSLGGFLALALAARGRARSVVALAPAGGWAPDDPAGTRVLGEFRITHRLVSAALPFVDRVLATPEGRRRATELITVAYEHLPVDLLVHQVHGVARCAVEPLVAVALRDGWPLDLAAIDCPVRIAWGTEDRLLAWPSAAARFREGLPTADWVVLDDVGHCPQLDRPAETAQLVLGHVG